MAVTLHRENSLVRFLRWAYAGLDRTIFMALKFTFPARFVSPLGFLGMLTFVIFIILGITGALLMLWYEPILDRAWDSVENINDTIPYGFHIRNIHYHASNAMVMMAILHMYYQYFSGRYKIRNEILWVTGVILGVLTILEAFTGYDIIFSERAELAISIAASLTNSIPILGPQMRDAFFGAGFHDFVLRFYAFHVFLLPIAMLGLMVVHFPRFLVFDVPMVMAITGAIMLTGGVFPVEMGLKFDPNVPPGITVPEWYLTGLYAFLRTQYDKFVTGVAWPGLFIFSLLVIPFVDKYKKFSWKDRPLITAVGITSLAQIIVTTYWGFYIDPNRTKSLLERLVIDPIFFYTVMLLLVPLSFGFTYMMIKLAKNAEANAKLQPRKPGGKTAINFPKKWIYIVFVALLAFQVYLNISAYYAVLNGMKNYSLFIIGIIMLVFAGMFHIYRHGTALARAPPPKPTTPPTTAKPMPAAPKAVPPVPKPTTTEPLTAPPVQKASSSAQVATKTSGTATTTTTTAATPPTDASASSSSKTGDTANVLAERSSTTEVHKK
ncbi:MAG TPA: cytochrome b N-terminal domain-containing protein [Nitrososphaeraceae archaeon]|nr:cytochrome b N-terminal domain-containing protein [Nitrososphaeraceae archaeon]